MGEGGDMPFNYKSDANWFAVSNKPANTDHFLGAARNNFDFVDKISGKPFGAYLNFQALFTALKGEVASDSSAAIALAASQKMWDNVIWKGGEISGGAITQTVEVNLVDKSTNSLRQLNQYAAKMGELYQEKKRKQKEEVMAYEDFESKQAADSVARATQ